MRTLCYLLEVSACTCIFLLFYQLFLSKVTFFTLNRWFLLLSLLTSFLIPAITIPATLSAEMRGDTSSFISTNQITIIEKKDMLRSEKPIMPELPWQKWVPLVYYTITGLLCFKLIISVSLLLLKIKKFKAQMLVDDVKILKADASLNNGSFFNYIFLNNNQLNETQTQQVIAHELIHVKRLHSIDILVAQIAQSILWLNPFIYLYTKKINENHEYEVDQMIIKDNSRNDYAALILHLSGSNSHSLYNTFSSMAPLKRRISILFKKPTSNMKKLIYLLTLPLVLISCIVFANKSSINSPIQMVKTVKPNLRNEDTVTTATTSRIANNKNSDYDLKKKEHIKPALSAVSLSTDSLTKTDTIASEILNKLAYSASDSIRINKDNTLIYLFGDANLQFTDTDKALCKLAGAYIVINRKTQNITAIGSTFNPILKEYKGFAQLSMGKEIVEAGTIKINLNHILKQVLLD